MCLIIHEKMLYLITNQLNKKNAIFAQHSETLLVSMQLLLGFHYESPVG